MKINITESDIKSMVLEGVKKAIFENVDIWDAVKDYNSWVVLNAVEDTLKADVPDIREKFATSGNPVRFAVGLIQNADDEKRNEFFKNVNKRQRELDGESGDNENQDSEPAGVKDEEPIDIFFDDDFEASLEESVDRVVSTLLNEATYDSRFAMERIQNVSKSYDAWYQKLYEIKNQSWKENDGRNIPELEHCFWAMRIMGEMNDLLNGYYYSIEDQLKQDNTAQQQMSQ
jgi:hypothetical protein